jgi:NAD+ kinase
MAKALRRVAVLTYLLPATTEAALTELAACRAELGIELLLPPEERAKHPAWRDLGYEAIADDELQTADVCLVLGGDGTILRALGRLVGSGVPTIGVNFGTVGFLATLRPDGWCRAFATIVAGNYGVVDLMTVEVTHLGRRFAGVNDVVLSRIEPRRVLNIAYGISGTHVGEMFCDGMIIASPSGSTAYNLSCDGPLVVWDARVLVLNFIAPHSLGFRPLVLRPDHVITARNTSAIDEAEIVVDGEVVGRLCCGEEIQVSAGRQVARLMVRAGGSFYQNVEEKLFRRSVNAR